MSTKVYGIWGNIPLGVTLLLVVSLWQFMQKECQIGLLANSPIWGKKGALFFAVQHFYVSTKRPSFASIAAPLGDWLCRIRSKKHSNLV